jgi:hypothetical protein
MARAGILRVRQFFCTGHSIYLPATYSSASLSAAALAADWSMKVLVLLWHLVPMGPQQVVISLPVTSTSQNVREECGARSSFSRIDERAPLFIDGI